MYGLAFQYILTKKYKCDFENESIKVMYSCSISGCDCDYNRLNHFCDSNTGWKKISEIIETRGYRRILHGRKYAPYVYWGTEILLCGDDGDLDELDDPYEIFLRTKPDTTEIIYGGALTDIQFGAGFYKNTLTNDVGDANRRISRDSLSTTIEYTSDYDEINTRVLREFHEAIRFDSVYKSKDRIAIYRLLSSEGKSVMASIRFEEYGKRFYFKVY